MRLKVHKASSLCNQQLNRHKGKIKSFFLARRLDLCGRLFFPPRIHPLSATQFVKSLSKGKTLLFLWDEHVLYLLWPIVCGSRTAEQVQAHLSLCDGIQLLPTRLSSLESLSQNTCAHALELQASVEVFHTKFLTRLQHQLSGEWMCYGEFCSPRDPSMWM